MGDYFKPWRRKIGVATLVMACVFAAGWINGLAAHPLDPNLIDFRKFATIPIQEHSIVGFGSSNHRLNCLAYESGQYTNSANDGTTTVGAFVMPVPIVSIPFWSIVLPLTLFSAWLLLSKPRKSVKGSRNFLTHASHPGQDSENLNVTRDVP